MKRLHVHVAVDDLARSIDFYSNLFASGPAVVEADYAKWMLEDPRVNFAISARGRRVGLDHLGIQVESDDELGAVAAALNGAGERIVEEQEATCCYARGNKAWVADPSGILWETFHSLGSAPVYGEDNASADSLVAPPETQGACAPSPAGSCCGPSIG